MIDNKEQKPAYDRKASIAAAMANAPAQDKSVLGAVGDTAISFFGDGIVGVGEAAVGLANIPTLGRAGKFLENTVGYDPKQAHEFFSSLKTDKSQEQMREFSETEGFGGKLNYARKNPSIIVNTVAESLPAMGLGGAVGRGLGFAARGLSPVAAGALGEGAVGAGLAAEQIRQQTEDGLLTGKQAGLAAATGATTAGFGYAGGRLARKLGIGDVDTIIAGGGRTANPAADIAGSTAANAAKNKGILRRGAEGALTEGLLEELPQSVSETILQNEALGRPLDEGVSDAAALGLLSGMAMGAGGGVIARNRAPENRLTPTEDMGQESTDYGAPTGGPDGGFNPSGLLGSQAAPQLGFQGRASQQFNAGPNGEVFTGDQYNEYLAQQQERARNERDAGTPQPSNFTDVTPTAEGYGEFGSDPRLPAPRSDFEVTPDGTAQTAADVNTSLQNEQQAQIEARARRARGEILDRTPVPIAPKPSELMGLDPNKGGLSAAAAIAVDSGASSVTADFEQASAPSQTAWQSGMTDRLANADQNNSTYARLAQTMQNEPTSVSEKTRLMREASEIPRAEIDAKQIKPNTRVLDESRAQTRAYTPEGKEVQAQWDVVDASDLVTSNTDSFTINPNFPASRQPRDRTRASAQQQVNDIASKLQPNMLGASSDVSTGAPFVGANDNVVDSGNGRSMAIRRVYQEGSEKAQEYRQFVNEQAGKFGLDTDAVNMMQSPVLVRRNTSDMNRDEFALAANKPTAARMSSTEQAASDAKSLPDASLLSFDSSGSMSLYQSQGYLKNFIAALPKTEQGSLMDDNGALSREGKSRIEAAIVQDAYNNPRLVSAISEKLDNDTTNVLKAITDKAPQISQINASIKTGDVYENTLARDIADATQAYMDIKNSERDVDDYLSQDSLFDDGLTDGAKEILSVLSDNKRSAKAIGEDIQQRINALTGKGNPKQGGLSFDDDIETDAPNVLSNQPASTNAKAATQLTDDNPTVNIPAPRQEVSTNDNSNPNASEADETADNAGTSRAKTGVSDRNAPKDADARQEQAGARFDTPSMGQEINPPKTYAQVQTEVANEMGITTNEDGEYDITDTQFDALEGRVRDRMETQENQNQPQSPAVKAETVQETKKPATKKEVEPVSEPKKNYWKPPALSETKNWKQSSTSHPKTLKYGRDSEHALLGENVYGNPVYQDDSTSGSRYVVKERGVLSTTDYDPRGNDMGLSVGKPSEFSTVAEANAADKLYVEKNNINKKKIIENANKQNKENGFDIAPKASEPKFSRAASEKATGSTNTTRQQVIDKLNSKFGKATVDKLMTDGKLDIKVLSDFVKDGKLTIPSDVDGLYLDGKATLIADNLSDDMIIPTFLHELGGHGGMQSLMDKKAYDALMKDFDKLVKAGDPLAVQAKAMADKVARNAQDALDEYLPYLITLASRQQAKQGKVAGMINRMVMAIRSWLKNTLGVPIQINSQDILSLAERMVNEVEKQNATPKAANAMPQFSDPNIPDKQVQDVRDKYEGTEEWLKAPNGKKTKLNEQQWLQVRTPAFKEWFGDWESDLDNSSKVVDDSGEPWVVYHGGTVGNTFDGGYNGSGSGRESAFFFTPDIRQAKDYAGTGSVKHAFINMRQPELTDYQLDPDEAIAAIDNGKDGYWVSDDHSDSDLMTESEIAVFNPNQIKSAADNAGTFDPNNNDIRYSRAGGMNDQFDPINLARESKQRLYDWVSSAPPGKLSWWHKTIGTMYNLAQRNPYFKPVFDNTEKFINDVSFYAAKASEFAPRLLPQLDSIRDITKSAIGAKDNEALSKPIFEGTLLWGRDLDGKAVLIEDWRKKVMSASKQDRLQMLKDANRITAAQLQELATLNNIQANRFINGIIDDEVNAGLVWTDAELRSKFNLDDKQIELYKEFRATTDNSLDSMTRSDMLRRLGKDAAAIETEVMEAGTLREAVFNIEQHINSLMQASPKKEKSLKNTLKDIKESKFRTNKLIDDGYTPLSRFGQYTVDVVDADGNREYFGMFESAYEARKMEAEMKALYDDPATHTISCGTLSNEEFKLFAGVTPETAELFGEMMGLDATGDKAADDAFQEYLRRTKNNRSTMKRLMHRKGIKGYSEDVGRVLASFVYSNARHTSAALNMGNLDRSIGEIPKGEGQLKDAAVKLAEYIKNPQEEGNVIRGWMFAQYLGGSIASAAVNLTQPIAVSFPYLSQFGGAGKAAAQLGKASSDWTKAFTSKSRSHFEPDLLAAIERAEADGTLSPQEVHNLLKQASGKNPLSAGDGTKVGDARALAGNTLSRVSLAWGALFSGAEQINRRVTFVAAYRLAVDQGMDNPAEFATKSIKETQFVYNKASRMNWGRGAVGGTLMTFKTYTVSYMELMHRLWSQGEKGSQERKDGRKAVGIMIGTLFLLGGAGGLPFMEDAEDLIDGIGQIMGYNFSSKKVRQAYLDEWLGEMGGDFIDGGISSVSGSPTDVSGRLGLGNLIPGTGVFKERTSNVRDILELAGPAGDFVGRIGTGSRDIAKGVANLDTTSLKKGALEFAPTAVRNAVKGVSMATTGMYKDTKGYKVADTSPVDAAFKAIGFQPRDISKIQEANYLGQSSTSYYNLRASNIRALWAAGVNEGNQSKVADARAAVKDWNAKNPTQKIVIKPTDIAKRVREMRMDKSDRVIKKAPKSSRSALAEDFAKAGR